MDMETYAGVVRVALSKRNLLTLLTKLDHNESARTISRETTEGLLVVVAEPDELHYADREPGLMVDWTEKDILDVVQ